MNYKNIYIAMRELTKTLVEINKESLDKLNYEESPIAYNYVEGRYSALENLLKSFNSMEELVTENEDDSPRGA